MPCEAVSRSATLLLWMRHHEYAAAVMVLSRKYSSTYGLTAFKLCGKLKRCHDTVCTKAYGTKDAHY